MTGRATRLLVAVALAGAVGLGTLPGCGALDLFKGDASVGVVSQART
jgi:hypothetical protein